MQIHYSYDYGYEMLISLSAHVWVAQYTATNEIAGKKTLFKTL